jgi:cbb3-type cytochrome c oxidase subunit III
MEPAPDPAATYEKFCAVCHGVDGMAATGTDSPQLANPAFLAAADDEYLRTTIGRGRPGTKMSTFLDELGGPMSRAEIDAVVEHVGTWRDPEFPTPEVFASSGDATAGRRIYEDKCSECHGPEGRSDTAPDLADEVFQQSASDAFLLHALRYGRPGTVMEPAALSATEMNDVISYLRALGSGR